MDSLIKGDQETHLEFLQWFRFFYVSNCKDYVDVQEATGDQAVSSDAGRSSATVGQ